MRGSSHSHGSRAGGTVISPILQERRPRHRKAMFTQLVSGRGPSHLQTAPGVICRRIRDMPRTFSGQLQWTEPTGAGMTGLELKPQGQPSVRGGKVPAPCPLWGHLCHLVFHTGSCGSSARRRCSHPQQQPAWDTTVLASFPTCSHALFPASAGLASTIHWLHPGARLGSALRKTHRKQQQNGVCSPSAA